LFSFKENKAAISLVAPGSFPRAKVAIAHFPGVFPRPLPTDSHHTEFGRSPDPNARTETDRSQPKRKGGRSRTDDECAPAQQNRARKIDWQGKNDAEKRPRGARVDRKGTDGK
jgi:hypothetical protein